MVKSTIKAKGLNDMGWAYRALMVLDIRIGTRLHIIRVIDTPSRVMNLSRFLSLISAIRGEYYTFKQKCKQIQINFQTPSIVQLGSLFSTNIHRCFWCNALEFTKKIKVPKV